MDRLPLELIEEILIVYAHISTKNDVLNKRLVCRDFNRILRPLACRTLNLDTTRLNRYSKFAKPQPETLQTIGHRCKALHIDMMVLRDDYEVYSLGEFLKVLPNMDNFCRALRRRYSFCKTAFTEDEFFNAITQILFYCRDVDRVRIYLPAPMVGLQSSVATRVLANALKALATRPPDDSAPLKTLVVDNITDRTLCELWTNPIDVRNMKSVLPSLETLVMTLRPHRRSSFPPSLYGISLWNTVFHAANIKSLCLTESVRKIGEEGVLSLTTSAEMDHSLWLEKGLPGPVLHVTPPLLRCLELKHLSISPGELIRIATTFGPTIEELYLNNVLLMTYQAAAGAPISDTHLWVGLPNQEPGERQWMAMMFRALMPNLRVCRCSYLGYRLFVDGGDDPNCAHFDYPDPAGLGRSVSQRFVEVVTGLRQPPLPSGRPMYFYAHDVAFHGLMHDLKERKRRIRIAEHDYHAHRLASADERLPNYQYSIDGLFRNSMANSIKELQYIADRVFEGVKAVHDRGEDPLVPDLYMPDPTPAT